LQKQYLETISSKFITNENLSYLQLTQGDNRKNVIYYYDLPDFPAGLAVLKTINENPEIPEFSFLKDDINGIKAFVVSIGTETHKVLLYKKHIHLSLVKAATVFGIRVSNHRFVKVTEDIIKLSPGIDFMLVDGHLIINSLKTLESGFGFETLIRKQAEANIAAISGLALLEDMTPLLELAADLSHAKKIMSIRADSPVMSRSADEIGSFIKNHPTIKKKFRFSEDGRKLKLDTMVSKRLFIKVMNDDYLNSKLTLLEYDSLAKDYLPDEIED